MLHHRSLESPPLLDSNCLQLKFLLFLSATTFVTTLGTVFEPHEAMAHDDENEEDGETADSDVQS